MFWPGGHSYHSYNHNSLQGPCSPTTSQREFCKANQLASMEKDLAQTKEIAEKIKVESGSPVCVMSALRANIEFWKSIGVLYFILSIIENGNKLPFASSPEPVKLSNNKSARLHAGFVARVIYDYVYNLFLIFYDLVLSGRICAVAQKPFVVSPLSVSIQPCSKKRLILVLHHVKCLVKQRIKYMDWNVALPYFTKVSYMFSFDLKSGITL